MVEIDKALIKSSITLTRFDPKARKELVVRGLNALSEVKNADFYFFKGEEHRIKEELNKAIENYDKALHIDPLHEDSLFWMGYCCLRWQRIGYDQEVNKIKLNEKAVSAFKKLIAIIEKKDSIWWRDHPVDYNYLKLAKELGIIHSLKNTVNYAVYYNLGLGQYNNDLYKEAIESFDSAIERNPFHANSYYMKGRSIYRLCNNEIEKYLSNRYDKSYHSEEEFESFDTVADIKKKYINEAIFCFDKALEINPKDVISWQEKGSCFKDLRNYYDAIRCYDKVLEIDPQMADAWKNKGDSLCLLGSCIYYKMLDMILILKEKSINNRNKQKRLEEAENIKKQHYEDALCCYEKAIEIDPQNAIIWKNKGDCFKTLCNYYDAIKCYDKALEIDPKDENVLKEKGYCFEMLGNKDKAIQCYDKVLGFNPESEYAWCSKGQCLEILGDYEEAIRCYGEALKLNTIDYSNFWYHKALAEDQCGRYNDAIYSYNQFLSLSNELDDEKDIEYAHKRLQELEKSRN